MKKPLSAEQKENIVPFSNGTEWMAWRENNCDECIKYDDDVNKTCPVERALAHASIADGTISPVMAARSGRPGKWDCPERVR